MRCAVVGCGLAGLGVAYALKKRGFEVDLFDTIGIGGGASSVASGLLHPYPSKKGLRTKFADEALEKTLELLDVAEKALGRPVARRNGILRKKWQPQEWHTDMVKQGDDVLIQSGCTVYMKSYLEGLFKSLGANFTKGELTNREEYDHVILAIGKGFKSLGLDGVQYVKGQILTCRSEESFERTVIGSGHISPLEEEGLVHVGSTYEHHARDDKPDLEVAQKYLSARIETFCPSFKDMEIVSCFAGVRVCTKENYLPIIRKLEDNIWAFTGLGSRGLLYHGLFGEKLTELILDGVE